MRIIHKLNDFLFTIFPDLMTGGGNNLIINTLEKYYSFGPYKPIINIDNDLIIIDIDTSTILTQDADYRKVVTHCEKGEYNHAKPLLKSLLQRNPTNSEYYRIMGQIKSDEGNQDEAINCLIDALRWDSRNGWALLMMGNIWAKFKNDIPTAMKYYDQALVANPNDNITINNIGANLLQQGKIEEAKKYFWEAIKINDKYPNTHYALGLIAEIENDLQSSFHSTIQALKHNKSKDVLFQNSFKQAINVARKIVEKGKGLDIFKEYKSKLEFEGGIEIDIVEDLNINTAAKFEFAENYNRTKHTVRYKPNHPAFEHLIMHELVHLEFVIEARKAGLNQLFLSNRSHKSLFIKGLESTIKKFQKMGIPDDSIASYCSDLFDGLNRQVYNAPIDLFIENYLYNEFIELRPSQFLSIYSIIQEGIKAVTDSKIVELSPKEILSKSKIYNIINAIQFKELFGIDLLNNYKSTQSELIQAQKLYEEYLEYKDDKEPAEEYELVIHWAEDLLLDKYFELEDEIQFRKRQNIDEFYDSLLKDPLGLDDRDPSKEREMLKFQKNQKEIGLNMAVVMFMVDALKFFDKMGKEEIRKIAFDIALIGTQGISPENKNYTVHSIPGKNFSGYNLLAYYFVSWSLAIPEMISELHLGYDNEYKLALTIHQS